MEERQREKIVKKDLRLDTSFFVGVYSCDGGGKERALRAKQEREDRTSKRDRNSRIVVSNHNPERKNKMKKGKRERERLSEQDRTERKERARAN